jgi:hypothetical protein
MRCSVVVGFERFPEAGTGRGERPGRSAPVQSVTRTPTRNIRPSTSYRFRLVGR